jgi:hypothetical protein
MEAVIFSTERGEREREERVEGLRKGRKEGKIEEEKKVFFSFFLFLCCCEFGWVLVGFLVPDLTTLIRRLNS